jgi:predicted ArsR family transcriptional regulator
VTPPDSLRDLSALSALEDPVRARLYALVCEAARPLRRDEAAAAAGISRSLAAYHLDALAARGLLTVSYARPADRGGPGAGRPAKLYRRAEQEFVARVPPRDYELLADVLVRSAADPRVAASIDAAARAAGRAIAGEHREETAGGVGGVVGLLRDRGYEPYVAAAGTLRLRNCPFREIALVHPDVVCRLNVSLVGGLLEGLGRSDARVELEPASAECCVAVRLTG